MTVQAYLIFMAVVVLVVGFVTYRRARSESEKWRRSLEGMNRVREMAREFREYSAKAFPRHGEKDR